MSLLPPKHPFVIHDDHIEVTEDVKPYKITGTTLAGVVGRSPWDTPFTTACKLLGLYREDISDKPAVHTGVVLEPRILSLAGAIPAESIFQPRAGEHGYWPSDWEDDVFGGHIDGMMPDGRVVEVKTTSDLSRWNGTIPEHYWIQASLYSHFLAGGEDIVFLVGLVDSETYKDPYRWNADGNLYEFETPIHPEIKRMVEYGRKWYANIQKGITPCFDENDPRDMKVLKSLRECKMEDNEMIELLEQIRDVQAEYDAYMETMKPVSDRLEDLKTTLKTQMVLRNMDTLSADGITVSISAQKRETVDLTRLRNDGYEIEEYVTLKTTNVMRIKRK